MARNGEARFWHFEIIPIVGLRTGRWHLVANSGIHAPVSGSAKRAGFEPSAKISYLTFGKNHFGAEYYSGRRPLAKVSSGCPAKSNALLDMGWQDWTIRHQRRHRSRNDRCVGPLRSENHLRNCFLDSAVSTRQLEAHASAKVQCLTCVRRPNRMCNKSTIGIAIPTPQ